MWLFTDSERRLLLRRSRQQWSVVGRQKIAFSVNGTDNFGQLLVWVTLFRRLFLERQARSNSYVVHELPNGILNFANREGWVGLKTAELNGFFDQ